LDKNYAGQPIFYMNKMPKAKKQKNPSRGATISVLGDKSIFYAGGSTQNSFKDYHAQSQK
jgi:hypothetical protein